MKKKKKKKNEKKKEKGGRKKEKVEIKTCLVQLLVRLARETTYPAPRRILLQAHNHPNCLAHRAVARVVRRADLARQTKSDNTHNTPTKFGGAPHTQPKQVKA